MKRLVVVFLAAALLSPFVPGQVRLVSGQQALAFFSQMLPYAQQENQQFGVPISVSLAQAAHESGLGTSDLAKNYNNYLGIKCHNVSYDNGPYAAGCTASSYRKYSTALNSFLDHGSFLKEQNPRYQGAFDYVSDPSEFLTRIWQAGYATDPDYVSKVKKYMDDNNLYQYDRPATTQPSGTTTQTIAYDGFETGNFSGGYGWRGDWQRDTYRYDSKITVTPLERPHSGSHHAKLYSYEDSLRARRSANLAGETGLRLQFWIKFADFAGDEYAQLWVSSDGERWDVAKVWLSDDTTAEYRFEDIDLSPYAMSERFFISFATEASTTGTVFLDDIAIVRAGAAAGPPPVPPIPGAAVPTSTLQLYRGWNNIAWLGQTAAGAQALSSIQGKYRVVYYWQAQTQTWQSFDPTAPSFANTLQNLTNGQAYWIYANQEVALTY